MAFNIPLAEILRNLITDKYMPLFDYYGTEFKFKTICHISAFSYCLCECGIQHECLDVITESGDIEEGTLEKIVKCIVNGECEHVRNSATEYVQEARIYPLHIIAAVPVISKEIEAKIDYLSKEDIDRLRSGLLSMTPYGMAILRNNLNCLMSKRYYINPRVWMISRQTNWKGAKTAKFRMVSLEDFCAEKKACQILEDTVEKFGFGFTLICGALQSAFKQNRHEIIEFILSKRKWFERGFTASKCCELAILYDQPKYLPTLLEYAGDDERQSDTLCKICNSLERWDCKRVLSVEGCSIVNEEPTSKTEKINQLIYDFRRCAKGGLGELLEMYSPYYKSLPSTSLQKVVVNCWVDVMGSTHWDLEDDFFEHDFFFHMTDAVSLESWIDSLSDADYKYYDHSNVSTPLIDLMSEDKCYDIVSFRKCLEVYIYQNPDVHLHESVVKLGILSDERLFTEKPALPLHSGTYVSDGELHGLCGHDDRYVLNMTGPFLMECGFLVLDEVYELVESKKDELPQHVSIYVQNYSSKPKPLIVLSREKLRSHFKGRAIHQFVKDATIPILIRDYILLKPLLRCLPKELNGNNGSGWFSV